MQSFPMFKGDTGPALGTILYDNKGEIVSLTGATVKFFMKNSNGEMVIDYRPAVIMDAETGEVAYFWGAGETDIEGVFYGAFHVTYSGGAGETFPNQEKIMIPIKD